MTLTARDREVAEKILTLHQHLHGRHWEPISCPSCRGLCNAIAQALADQREELARKVEAFHSTRRYYDLAMIVDALRQDPQ